MGAVGRDARAVAVHHWHDGWTATCFILGRNDLWCWESSLLEFHYAERAGPALVDLALFGYVAVRLIRPQGLAAIRHT